MSALTNYRPKPNVFSVTAQEAAKRIQWPLSTWPGNCFGVASKLVKDKVIKGTAVYGHWLGPVARTCKMFYGKPIINHGWILQKDGTVVDPTRYVFEGVQPYIWEGKQSDTVTCDDFESNDPLDPVCKHCGHLDDEHEPSGFFRPCKLCVWPYDEGGNKLRAARMEPAPDCNIGYRDGTRWGEYVRWRVPNKETRIVIDILFGAAKRRSGYLTRNQIHWLANVPYDMFTPTASRDFAPDIYSLIAEAGMLSHVPIDNQRRAERTRRAG
ncbi:MAG: hypothetical protein EPN91_08640 [Salinibacterium sp.]|nr:MAG: hypothetical protein EPN91_08640 [Salinibacterium sp.]